MKRRPVIIALVVIIIITFAIIIYFKANPFHKNTEGSFKNEDAQAIINQPAVAQREVIAEVLPKNVKGILADIKPIDAFKRSVRINYQGEEKSLTRTATHYKSGNSWRTELYDSQLTLSKTAVSDGKTIAIKDNVTGTIYHGSIGDKFTADSQLGVADLSFFLNMPESDISQARIEHLGEESVIFIECNFPEMEQTDRYWVSLVYGVLLRAETVVTEKVVYQFETSSITADKPQDSLFDLESFK